MKRMCFFTLLFPLNHLLQIWHCTFSILCSPRCSLMWRSIASFVRNVLPQVAHICWLSCPCIWAICTFSA
uniref:Putative secreted protein n=1 Tax=Anopheles darlingi TaxID=43151 RepID=A0A2M4DI25_ANODA